MEKVIVIGNGNNSVLIAQEMIKSGYKPDFRILTKGSHSPFFLSYKPDFYYKKQKNKECFYDANNNFKFNINSFTCE